MRLEAPWWRCEIQADLQIILIFFVFHIVKGKLTGLDYKATK